MPGITETIAQTTAALSYDDLPDEVAHAATRVFVDSVGCALGGYAVERGSIAVDLANELGGRPVSTIIGAGLTSPTLAAYANGELVNALDYDALGPLTGHVIPFVVPPALALAESVRASGRDLLTAIVIGLEIGARVAGALPRNWQPSPEPPYYEANPGFTYGVAIFGAVAAAGKILGLSSRQIAHAFGIAGNNMPAAAAERWEHSQGLAAMTKYGCSTGNVAEMATKAALLAQKGFTADAAFLDGDDSLQRIYNLAYFDASKVVHDLGATWHTGLVSFKMFPGCGANHTTIQALLRILAEHAIDPEAIEEITVLGDPWMLTPNRSHDRVETFADAQFCNLYLAALTPYHGATPGPAWQLPETYRDPRVLRMMRKVKIAVNPATIGSGTPKPGDAQKSGSSRWTSARQVIVEVQANGRRYRAEESVTRGSANDPLSDMEVRAKFLTNAGFSRLSPTRAAQALEAAYQVERLDDLDELMGLLRSDEGSDRPDPAMAGSPSKVRR